MSDARRIFIKVDTEWSYNYIGSIKDQVSLSPEVMAQYYTLACDYLRIRHNFVAGIITNTQYTDEFYMLFKPLEANSWLDSMVKHCVENLYRRCRPVLEYHPQQIANVNFINDDAGDINGVVLHYTEIRPMTSLQFA